MPHKGRYKEERRAPRRDRYTYEETQTSTEYPETTHENVDDGWGVQHKGAAKWNRDWEQGAGRGDPYVDVRKGSYGGMEEEAAPHVRAAVSFTPRAGELAGKASFGIPEEWGIGERDIIGTPP